MLPFREEARDFIVEESDMGRDWWTPKILPSVVVMAQGFASVKK